MLPLDTLSIYYLNDINKITSSSIIFYNFSFSISSNSLGPFGYLVLILKLSIDYLFTIGVWGYLYIAIYESYFLGWGECCYDKSPDCITSS